MQRLQRWHRGFCRPGRAPVKVLQMRRRRLMSETAWVFFGQGLSAVATLVGLRLITELVPPQVYGTVALALGTITLAHGLIAGPLMQAVLRLFPDVAADGGERELRRAALLAMRKPALLALAVLTLAGAVWALRRPGDVWIVVLTPLLFVAEVARSVEITFLNATRRQREMALLTIADAWARPLAAVALVWVFGAGGGAVIGGYLTGCLLALAGFWLLAGARRPAAAQLAGATSLAAHLPGRLWAYALPLTAVPLIGWVSGQADRYIVAGFAGVTAAGIYSALYGAASRPFLILSASVELALRQPYYVTVSAGDRTKERRFLTFWLAAVTAGSVGLWLVFLLFHAQIATFLLAMEYRAHSALMGWIAAGYVLLAAAQVVERVCYAYHDTRGVLLVQATGAALSVAVALPMVARFGISGAAWAVPIYFGAQLALTVWRASWVKRRRWGIPGESSEVRPAFLVSADKASTARSARA